MTLLGDAFVRLRPDTSGFEAEGRKSILGPTKNLAAAAAGIFAGVATVSFLKEAIADAREAAKLTRLTTSTIKATGSAAKVTASQVTDLAGSLAMKTGIDDGVIQSGENLILTFKGIRNEAGKGNDIFNQATKAAVDLSASGFGSVESASVMLGKALNDPIKGVTALQRVGVGFTESQKKQIATLVESGKTLEAQKVILKEVNAQVGGNAAAAADPMARLSFVAGELKESIGTLLLPVVDKFGTFMADTVVPAVQSGVTWVGNLIEKIKGLDLPSLKIPGLDLSALDIGSKLKSAGGKVITAIKDSISQGDISPLTDALSTMTQDALDKASDKWTAVAYVKDLVEKLKKGTESGDWTAVGAALQDAIGDALSGASDLGKTIFDWVSMTLKKVKWFDLGIEAGKQVPAMLLGLALGILNFDPMPILIGLKDHWFDVVIAVLTLAFLPGKVVGAIAKVFSKVPFAGPLLEWLFRESVVISKRLVTFAGDLIGGFVRGLTGGGGRLTGFFRGIFEDIKLHLYVWGDDLLKFIKGVPDKLLNGSLQGMERLGTWYREAFTSLWGAVKAVFITGIALVIGIFLGFVGDLLDGAAKMLGWVPGIGPKLKAAAADFATFRDDVNSRLGGINDKDVEIRTKLISGEILSAAYKPGGSTYNSQVPEKARSIGGSVFGPGSSTSDSIPAMLSNGEHVWSAREVAKAGGHAAVAAMRSNVLHRAKGGPIGGDIGGSVPAGSEHGLFVKTSGLDANAFATTAEKFVDAQAEAFRKAQQKKADDNPAFAGGGGGSAAEVLLRHLGVPYSWGGGNTSGPTRGFAQGANTIGWDCSSYVQYGVFQALHKLIPRTAAAQQAALKATSGGPGQLVFYGRPAHHVAMMLGNGQMVEEPHTGASSRVTAFRPGTSYAMYDNGGYLQPGTDLQAVYNHTGKPEPVFTSDQWEILKGNLAGAGTTEVRVFIGDRDITDIVRSEVKRGTDGVATALRQGRR